MIGSIFAALHVAMKAVRVVLAAARIMKMLFATLGNSPVSPGSCRSALLTAALPALKPRFRRREAEEPESVGRGVPLGLALLVGVGSLGAANLEAAAGLAHFAVSIASNPVICAAAWAIRQLVAERADQGWG
jgi:hypothetical protein